MWAVAAALLGIVADRVACDALGAMTSAVGRNDFRPCGSGKKFKRCCPGGTGTTARAAVPEENVTVLVDTNFGLMARRVPAAPSLDPTASQTIELDDPRRDLKEKRATS
jgi:hypothetical protein